MNPKIENLNSPAKTGSTGVSLNATHPETIDEFIGPDHLKSLKGLIAWSPI
jgi:hypothetical protein